MLSQKKPEVLLWAKIINLLLLEYLMLACQPHASINSSKNKETTALTPSKFPINAASGTVYQAPIEKKKECLGRLLFDVESLVEWPTYYKADLSDIFHHSFSQNVNNPGDKIKFGNISLSIIDLERIEPGNNPLSFTPSAKMKFYISDLATGEAELIRVKSKKSKTERDRWNLNFANSWVDSAKSRIKNLAERFEEFATGLPDTEAYWTSETEEVSPDQGYSILRAYLTRGKLLYVFESYELMDSIAVKSRHKKEFAALLSRFRTRVPGEIPKEIGLCFPYGFIPDDGKTEVEIKESIRYSDAPGILYTIETATVTPERFKAPLVTALANATIAIPLPNPQANEKLSIMRRIGPRVQYIGNLKASQGGVVIQVTPVVGQPFDKYTVYTGYEGVPGSAVLPYITVDMRSISMDQASELKLNPPPFDHSMKRLERLLSSIRLRPTVPTMPELAGK